MAPCDTHGACLLVEADSEEQVRETLSTLPYFRAGMLEILYPAEALRGVRAPQDTINPGSPQTAFGWE